MVGWTCRKTLLYRIPVYVADVQVVVRCVTNTMIAESTLPDGKAK